MVAVASSKTHRLYLLLKEGIASGRLAAGLQLPGELALAETHRLSRVTVRRALDGLQHDGLIRRLPGAGTFVVGAQQRHAVVGDLSNTIAHLVTMGRATQVELLSFGYGPPPPDVRAALNLPETGRTQRAVRVRSLDGAPFSYLVTHVPERIGRTFTARDLAKAPLLSLLERSGVRAGRARQHVSATLAGPDVANHLSIEIGAPLIALTRTVFDTDGAGVEHLAALYRPDLYQFEMELTRHGAASARRWQPVELTPNPANRRRSAAPRRRPS
jgi:GntR family transcriptional regulator